MASDEANSSKVLRGGSSAVSLETSHFVARPGARSRVRLPHPLMQIRGRERGELAREACQVRRLDDGGDVLVGAGSLLGDTAHRWALDDDAALTKLVHDRP